MISDYDDYEKTCSMIKKENEEYLALFEADLINSGLSERTVIRHLRNVGFYINVFLLREGPQHMESGTFLLDLFLGDFFIRKCGWSTPGNIKAYASSIKKFYRSMLEHEKISKDFYDDLCLDIKENLTTWQNTCEIYNDLDAPNPFSFPF